MDMILYELFEVIGSEEDVLEFLIQRNVLDRTRACDTCNRAINFDSKLTFRCRRKNKCNFNEHLFKNTVFEKSHIKPKILIIFFAFKLTFDPTQHKLAKQLKLSEHTIVKLNRIHRGICLMNWDREFRQLGGEGEIVEIDETRFGPGESSSDRKLGYWVLGGVQRSNKKTFATVINGKRSFENLFRLITHYVAPGTIIYTDGWLAYRQLTIHGYPHKWVNHKYYFVDPEEGTHTQTIESGWAALKAEIPMKGGLKESFDLYYAEYQYRKTHDETTIINQFFTDLPHSNQEDILLYSNPNPPDLDE